MAQIQLNSNPYLMQIQLNCNLYLTIIYFALHGLYWVIDDMNMQYLLISQYDNYVMLNEK